ncbi:MAG TPA: CHAT domain-containing protein [Phycisphaerales bacterium]|nr:CHAT domain-containing protein [Phycisphaerales bacterium]HIN83986.1 CHAT domain-containing protein [Phycisphaerales bacterium]
MTQQEMTSDLLDLLISTPVEQRWPVLRDSGKPLEELHAMMLEVSNRTMVDLKSAKNSGKVVVGLADVTNDSLCMAKARRTLSRVLAYASEYDCAIETANEGSQIALQGGLQEEAARGQLASMHALTEMGRFDEAAQVGKEARVIFNELDLPAMSARADINLGVVYQHMGQPEKSIICLQRAKDGVADEPNILGHLENNLGEALLAVDDIENAECAFQNAREAFLDAKASLTAAIAEGNLADLAARRGRLSESLSWFEHARQRLAPIDAGGHLARLLAERAETLSTVGMYETSKRAYEEAIPRLDEACLPVEAARARRGFGRTLLKIGDLSSASTMLASAAIACEELSLFTERASVDLDRARLAISFGNMDEAQRLAYQALARFQNKPVHEAEARLVLAHALLHHDPLRAESEIDAVEVLARRLDIPPVLVSVLHLRGQLRRSQGRLSLAVAAFSEAIDHADRIRGTVQADRCRAAIGQQHRQVFEDQLATLIEMGDENRTAQAFVVADKMGRRVLLDQARRAATLQDAEVTNEETNATHPDQREYTLLKEKLSVMYSQLADGIDETTFNVDRWRKKLRATEVQLETLELRLAACGNASYESSRLDIAELQLRLTSDTTLLQYAIVDEKIIAFVVTSDSVEMVRHLGNVHEIEDLLETFRFQVDRAVGSSVVSRRRFPRMIEDTKNVLAELYDVLFSRLPKNISESNRLVIIPQGLLNLVPFHALHDGEQYLIEKCVIQYVPSASLYKHVVERQSRNTIDSPLVIGCVATELPAIEEEVDQVAAFLGTSTTILRDKESTVSNFRKYATKASILHLAGHGCFSTSNTGATGIRMYDRWLTLNEINSLNLSAELVVLSSCESGPARAIDGDDATGLFQGFLAGGAKGVLASLWRVSDESSKNTFAYFYSKAYSKDCTLPFGKALQQAQLEVMKEMPHPAHWAAFMFTGADQ